MDRRAAMGLLGTAVALFLLAPLLSGPHTSGGILPARTPGAPPTTSPPPSLGPATPPGTQPTTGPTDDTPWWDQWPRTAWAPNRPPPTTDPFNVTVTLQGPGWYAWDLNLTQDRILSVAIVSPPPGEIAHDAYVAAQIVMVAGGDGDGPHVTARWGVANQPRNVSGNPAWDPSLIQGPVHTFAQNHYRVVFATNLPVASFWVTHLRGEQDPASSTRTFHALAHSDLRWEALRAGESLEEDPDVGTPAFTRTTRWPASWRVAGPGSWLGYLVRIEPEVEHRSGPWQDTMTLRGVFENGADLAPVVRQWSGSNHGPASRDVVGYHALLNIGTGNYTVSLERILEEGPEPVPPQSRDELAQVVLYLPFGDPPPV